MKPPAEVIGALASIYWLSDFVQWFLYASVPIETEEEKQKSLAYIEKVERACALLKQWIQRSHFAGSGS